MADRRGSGIVVCFIELLVNRLPQRHLNKCASGSNLE